MTLTPISYEDQAAVMRGTLTLDQAHARARARLQRGGVIARSHDDKIPVLLDNSYVLNRHQLDRIRQNPGA